MNCSARLNVRPYGWHQVISRFREVILTRWLNPRRKRFWAVVVVLIYTLLGFFAAPLIVKNTVINLVTEDIGRAAIIEKVEINPYVLSLRVQGFVMHDIDGVKLAGFDEFFVNLQLSSLFNWAWTFSEVRLADPYFFFERFDLQNSRLSRVLTDISELQTEADADKQPGAPRLLIHDLVLSDGRIDAKDNVPATVVEMSFAPINISIQELNTLPDRDGQQSVTIRLPNDGVLKWDGSLTLAPLDAEGDLVLENLSLDQTIAYLETILPLETIVVRLSSRFHYRIYTGRDGQLNAELDGLKVEVDNLAVTGLAPTTDFLSVEKIIVDGGALRYPAQTLQFSKLRIREPHLTVWLDENAKFNLDQLLLTSANGSDSVKPVTQPTTWQFGLGELVIEAGGLALSDQSVEPAASVEISDLQARLTGLSNQQDALFPLNLSGSLPEGGSFSVDGSLGLLPGVSFAGESRFQNIPLSLGQPYLLQYARVSLESGVLNGETQVAMPAGQAIVAGGAIQISRLEINNSIDQQRLFGWNELDIDRFDLDSGSSKLHISRLHFEQLFGRLIIHQDKSTNLSALVIEQTEDATDTASDALKVIIGGIQFDDGSMDFSDMSLPLPFTTHIARLNGTISTIDTDSNESANIRLEGKVDEFGLARIDGSINLLDPTRHTDVTVEFRNLLMPRMSPYTIEFAGRGIDAGKLDLSLNYKISDGMLRGENDVVLSDLVLGEKVDHPDAASLPLGLAVALLKDADGVIRIDLPVKGDINDPEFKIGGIVWQAIAGLITKIVSAPFRLLGNLIGIDSEDLGQFEFLAGRADLTPPELEKIVQLEEALRQRPELTVEISGVSDQVIDIPALKLIRLRNLAGQRLGEELGDEEHETMMLDAGIRVVLEIMFNERYPDIPLDSLKLEHMAAPADDPEGKQVLDNLAYAADLWKRLLASEVINTQDLAELAQARALAIRTAFLASGQFDKGRVVIAAPKEVESEDGEWVRLELAVVPD